MKMLITVTAQDLIEMSKVKAKGLGMDIPSNSKGSVEIENHEGYDAFTVTGKDKVVNVVFDIPE